MGKKKDQAGKGEKRKRKRGINQTEKNGGVDLHASKEEKKRQPGITVWINKLYYNQGKKRGKLLLGT